MLTAAAKAETLKEEYEEETAKFEACQVRLSVEFYTHWLNSFPCTWDNGIWDLNKINKNESVNHCCAN